MSIALIIAKGWMAIEDVEELVLFGVTVTKSRDVCPGKTSQVDAKIG